MNPYDPRIAFDDIGIFGGSMGGNDTLYVGAGYQQRDLLESAHAILRRAHQRKRRPHTRVIVGVEDTTSHTFEFEEEGVLYSVLGDDAPPIDFPIYGAYYKQFSDALPQSKLARVDDVQSYADFRAARRDPYISSLEARLSALEIAFADHVADHHGGGQLAALAEALSQHLDEVSRGGEHIPLPGSETGQIEAWRDGAEILCTVRVCAPDGSPLMLTSGTPVSEHAEEVVGCAGEEDVAPEDLLAVGPAIISLVGAAKLAEQILCCADNVIMCCGGARGTAALVPARDLATLAAMALLQRCQQGDWAACKEARMMQRDHRDLLADAAGQFIYAQQLKAAGRL